MKQGHSFLLVFLAHFFSPRVAANFCLFLATKKKAKNWAWRVGLCGKGGFVRQDFFFSALCLI